MEGQTPLMADGLLGWPGFGPGGSQKWRAQQLATGDVWYAPRSAFYLITGCAGGGAGGGGTALGGKGSGGGSGGGLINYPLYIPEGYGGVVVVGAGGTGVVSGNGNAGDDTTFGNVLTFTGGGGGGTVSGAAGTAGTVGGYWLNLQDRLVKSAGRNGYVGSNSYFSGPGAPGILDSASGYSVINGMISGRLSKGGAPLTTGTGIAGESFGSGGSGGAQDSVPGGAGGDGVLIIAWVGAL
jgi:hypothetical protein